MADFRKSNYHAAAKEQSRDRYLSGLITAKEKETRQPQLYSDKTKVICYLGGMLKLIDELKRTDPNLEIKVALLAAEEMIDKLGNEIGTREKNELLGLIKSLGMTMKPEKLKEANSLRVSLIEKATDIDPGFYCQTMDSVREKLIKNEKEETISKKASDLNRWLEFFNNFSSMEESQNLSIVPEIINRLIEEKQLSSEEEKKLRELEAVCSALINKERGVQNGERKR
jgi:hypothetical protein